MSAYAELQEAEFAAGAHGYTATRHQREVGTGYFDEVSIVISSGESSTTALHGSTETAQFETPRSAVAFRQSKQLRKGGGALVPSGRPAIMSKARKRGDRAWLGVEPASEGRTDSTSH